MENRKAFIGMTTKPTSKELVAALGPTSTVWNQLMDSLTDELGVLDQEWNSVKPVKYGWSFILKVKKRRIIYLNPRAGSFQAMFILSDKAMAAARASKFPKSIVKIFGEAPHHPEGTGIRITVNNEKLLPAIRKLASIKRAN